MCTCVHVCARGAQESCLVSVLCGQMKVGLFLLSLCFSLSFFYSSSSSSHSAINPNSHLSDQREGWSFSLLTHLQFAHRLCPSVGTSGLGQLPQARSSRACPPVGLCSSVCGLAGRQDQGWVGRPSALHAPAALESPTHCVSACPLSQAPLLERPRMHGAWHKTAPHLCTQARLALCSWCSSRMIVESCGQRDCQG